MRFHGLLMGIPGIFNVFFFFNAIISWEKEDVEDDDGKIKNHV